ncbi:PilN domain-containing protein [Natronincola ferrireducens]|uniref:Type IV pilus assembly protein PilN n=1 Tax=Natronincola ferrireducens TaxID=393762 RepID=A0A1G9CK08_9FIRM|nr:PilN domain-containing protein [Natronincola ferrireducens]SDK52017.1 type IV pilus assembly protein PilN [Natronincola ferrireducens]
MRDLNFFEPYVAKQRGIEKKQKVFYSILLLLVLVVISFPAINFIRINNMEKEIASINAILARPEVIEQMQRIEYKESRVDTLENQLQLLANIDQGIENLDIINELLVYGVFGTIPENLFFQSMSITPNSMTIQGSAKDKGSIAEFEYNLRLTQAFDEIFIPSITINEGIYNFAIQFKVKDVN